MKAQVTKCMTIIWQMIFLKHNKLVEKLILNLFWANSFTKQISDSAMKQNYLNIHFKKIILIVRLISSNENIS